MLMNLTDILSKQKRQVYRLYKNLEHQVFLSLITLRVAVKIKCRGLIRSLTSLPTVLYGIHVTRWAEELVEQCAAFPQGAHDDLVDCTTLALMRFRQGDFSVYYNDFEKKNMIGKPPRKHLIIKD